jgi:ketosteroid isomerase-like protein
VVRVVLSWIATKIIGFLMARNRAGDIRATLAFDAPDVRLTFPGQNRWSGVFAGRDAVRRWLEVLIETGVMTYPDQVVSVGPPWNTTICVRGHDHADGPDGERVYENRFVIWGRMSWGRLKDYEVYEDTHLANEYDRWLAEHRPEVTSELALAS